MAVKTVHLLVLLLICGIGFYNLSVRSQKSPPAEEQEKKAGALTIVESSEQEQDGELVQHL